MLLGGLCCLAGTVSTLRVRQPATSWRPWSIRAQTRDTEDPKVRLEFEKGLAPEGRLMTEYLTEAPASGSEPLVLSGYSTSAMGYPTGTIHHLRPRFGISGGCPDRLLFMICREPPAIYTRGRPVALKTTGCAQCCDLL
jgi:hypothetical protein